MTASWAVHVVPEDPDDVPYARADIADWIPESVGARGGQWWQSQRNGAPHAKRWPREARAMTDLARYARLGAKPPQRCGWCGRFVSPHPYLPAYAAPLCERCYDGGEGYMERPGQ